ncbi:MAG: glycoside hydrolase 15-related [Herminiimonas sp.]|nr:glycoside hydrolase 15-related [Herminiimonas sp.]
MPSRIEDYALLGNCKTAALISRNGSIDWLCFPRFDAPSCFSALLGEPKNGRWKLAPRGPIASSARAYLDGTLVLETTVTTEHGSARITDFMPYSSCDNCVVRIVTGLHGSVAFDMDLAIRFDYGSSVPWVERHDAQTLTAVAGPDMLVLRTTALLEARDLRTTSQFDVTAGQRIVFTLSWQPSNCAVAEPIDIDAALSSTVYFWREFSDRCPDVGAYTALVKRSLITLKALTYQPTGGIVAAVTTSLPECIGGERNWDYRYCWLRDATMTLLAFIYLGYIEEAAAWYEWLLRSIAGNPEQMQIMYGLGGERRLTEFELPWLAGYEGSKPVRIGNAAAVQFQLDVYGEVADAISHARKGGLPTHRRSAAIADVVMPYLERAWREPDDGIWEIRGARRHFTHSKVMAWVAFERAAANAATQPGREIFRAHCSKVAAEIHEDVCLNGFNAELGCFVQSYGSSTLDASLLQIALTGFLPASDPRFLATLEMIERHLMTNGLLCRYRTGENIDGLPPGEGTFLVCSFWLADVYGLLGRHDDARMLYEHLTGLCNDVGLLSEQFDPHAGRMLGNFPQAFSHIGIINTALNLHRAVLPQIRRTGSRE